MKECIQGRSCAKIKIKWDGKEKVKGGKDKNRGWKGKMKGRTKGNLRWEVTLWITLTLLHITLLIATPLYSPHFLSSPPSIPLLPSSLSPSILSSSLLSSSLLSSSLLHSPCFDFISRRRTDFSPVIFVLPFHSDRSSYSIETEKREVKKEIGINRQSKEVHKLSNNYIIWNKNCVTSQNTSPFLSFPLLSFPLLSSPFLSSPLLSSPFLSSPFFSSPLHSSPSANLAFPCLPYSPFLFPSSLSSSNLNLVSSRMWKCFNMKYGISRIYWSSCKN